MTANMWTVAVKNVPGSNWTLISRCTTCEGSKKVPPPSVSLVNPDATICHACEGQGYRRHAFATAADLKSHVDAIV
jgi:DnaJ-class molecular chaperone